MTYTNDVLGNRTGKTPSSGSSTSYGWDDFNRMTSLSVGSTATSYVYRADGLRVSKSSSSGSTVYRYDGQMGSEDVELNSSSAITAITRNALGARGIDAISRTTSSGTTVAYPLYDAHGNNVGMLTKSGSSWSLSDERTYDAWGVVRSGATTGDQKGRYCANLGHKQDDESGLVYMRARYYEPTSGRFVNQDRTREGFNWYVYCVNDGINKVDESGASTDDARYYYTCGIIYGALGTLLAIYGSKALIDEICPRSISISALAVGCFFAAIFCYTRGLDEQSPQSKMAQNILAGMQAIASATIVYLVVTVEKAAEGMSRLKNYVGVMGNVLATACINYALQCISALVCIDNGW